MRGVASEGLDYSTYARIVDCLLAQHQPAADAEIAAVPHAANIGRVASVEPGDVQAAWGTMVPNVRCTAA